MMIFEWGEGKKKVQLVGDNDAGGDDGLLSVASSPTKEDTRGWEPPGR